MNAINKNLVLNIFLTIVCMSGMLYQSTELIREYSLGKTIVNIKVGKKLNATLPAITICYPHAVSLEKVFKLSPGLLNLYKKYNDAIENVTRENFIGKKNADIISSTVNYKIYQELKKLYSVLNGVKYLENVSLPYRNEDGTSAINLQLFGLIKDKHFNPDFKLVNSIVLKLEFNGTPVDSIAPSIDSRERKCFTFFSHYSYLFVQKQWRDFQMNLEEMKMIVFHQYQWFPYCDKIYLSIHSPNTLPDLTIGQNFIELNMKFEYQLIYSRLETNLLGSGYDTNCFDYDLDYKFANFNMRSDCVMDCIQKQALNRSGVILKKQRFTKFNNLFRKDYFSQYKDIDMAFWIDPDTFNNAGECVSQCPRDCHFIYFQTQIIGERNVSSKYSSFGISSTRISIKHGETPDIVITHLPELTFISFVSNFGGLLGIWLGFNILMIFNKTSILFYNLIINKQINRINKLNLIQISQNNNWMTKIDRKNVFLRK